MYKVALRVCVCVSGGGCVWEGGEGVLVRLHGSTFSSKLMPVF